MATRKYFPFTKSRDLPVVVVVGSVVVVVGSVVVVVVGAGVVVVAARIGR